MFKDELGGKIITKCIALRAKTYSYLIDDCDDDDDDDYDKNNIINKKGQKCVIKRRPKFKDYYDSLFKNKNILRIQQRFKSDCHRECIEKVNKIALSSNDDKRLQTFDRITAYPYGTKCF